MRQIVNFNADWFFSKETCDTPVSLPTGWEAISLPHSWNATDGQDGGNDYHRGACWYVKTLNKADLPAADRYYLELQGANSSADVYLSGKHLAHHDGGYSTWRVDLTDHLTGSDLLAVKVDNSPNDTVYPQMADFTF